MQFFPFYLLSLVLLCLACPPPLSSPPLGRVPAASYGPNETLIVCLTRTFVCQAQ
jgi:hypothetical protein